MIVFLNDFYWNGFFIWKFFGFGSWMNLVVFCYELNVVVGGVIVYKLMEMFEGFWWFNGGFLFILICISN